MQEVDLLTLSAQANVMLLGAFSALLGLLGTRFLKRMDQIIEEIKSLSEHTASKISNLTEHTNDRISHLDNRVTRIETLCGERRKIARDEI